MYVYDGYSFCIVASAGSLLLYFVTQLSPYRSLEL